MIYYLYDFSKSFGLSEGVDIRSTVVSIVGRKLSRTQKENMVVWLHPEAEREEIYRLRVVLRQGDLNMWVTAFDEVAEAILGITVKKFSAFDDDGTKSCRGSERDEMLHDH